MVEQLWQLVVVVVEEEVVVLTVPGGCCPPGCVEPAVVDVPGEAGGGRQVWSLRRVSD